MVKSVRLRGGKVNRRHRLRALPLSGRPQGMAGQLTVHRFVTANAAALGVLRDGLPRVIGWAEFRPEGEARPASAGGLSYRIADRGRTAAARDEPTEERTPVMVRLGAVDLATVDALITAGVVNSRGRGPALGPEPAPGTPGLRPPPAASGRERGPRDAVTARLPRAGQDNARLTGVSSRDIHWRDGPPGPPGPCPGPGLWKLAETFLGSEVTASGPMGYGST
jgi:hypothetical protein